jgi:thymidylate synthase (FAD)
MRTVAPSLEDLIGVKLPVLDDGFVRVIDYMGSDESIVQAARVSYGAGTKQVHKDRGLIRYLLRHHHTTPFEMCEIKLHVRVPMDCWRQWIRHRTANVNEYSTRYSVAIDSAQKTSKDAWRSQSASNKQGSSGLLPDQVGSYLTEVEASLHSRSRKVYAERLESGVAREQARKDLPLSTYTEAYWKIDLHNLLHFLHLRMDEHAQSEIRQYASTIGQEIVSKWCPITWEAFLDYKKNSVTLSSQEIEIIRLVVSNDASAVRDFVLSANLIKEENGIFKESRELIEIKQKLLRFGIDTPTWHESLDR